MCCRAGADIGCRSRDSFRRSTNSDLRLLLAGNHLLIDPWRASGRRLPCVMFIHCDSCTFSSFLFFLMDTLIPLFMYRYSYCPYLFSLFCIISSRILVMIAFWSLGYSACPWMRVQMVHAQCKYDLSEETQAAISKPSLRRATRLIDFILYRE